MYVYIKKQKNTSNRKQLISMLFHFYHLVTLTYKNRGKENSPHKGVTYFVFFCGI